jgi:hypothetical protein
MDEDICGPSLNWSSTAPASQALGHVKIKQYQCFKFFRQALPMPHGRNRPAVIAGPSRAVTVDTLLLACA